jgi:hypothetical protein
VLLGVGLIPVIAYFSLSGCAVKMLDCSWWKDQGSHITLLHKYYSCYG